MKSLEVSTEIVVFQFFRINQLKLKNNLLNKNVIFSFVFENLIFEKLLYTHFFVFFENLLYETVKMDVTKI